MIRRAVTADSHGIALAHVAAWQAAYRGIVPQPFLDRLSVTERTQRFAETLERTDSETLVADANGEVVGFVSLGKSLQKDASADIGEIYAIYVAPSHWSTGMGRALCHAALARLRELKFVRVIVWTLEANARAIRFYERAGFTLAPGSATKIEIGGASLPEVRYEIDTALVR